MPPASMPTRVFEPLFGEQDAIISDALNHASIIDGVRLCKAVRYRYANADMNELEECLKKAQAQLSASSAPTASSRWTATPRRSTRSAPWPRSTTRW